MNIFYWFFKSQKANNFCAASINALVNDYYSIVNVKVLLTSNSCTKFLQLIDAAIINYFKRHSEKYRID